MWIWEEFLTFVNIRRCAFYTIYCHSPEGDTAVAFGDVAFCSLTRGRHCSGLRRGGICSLTRGRRCSGLRRCDILLTHQRATLQRLGGVCTLLGHLKAYCLFARFCLCFHRSSIGSISWPYNSPVHVDWNSNTIDWSGSHRTCRRHLHWNRC